MTAPADVAADGLAGGVGRLPALKERGRWREPAVTDTDWGLVSAVGSENQATAKMVAQLLDSCAESLIKGLPAPRRA